MKRTRILALIGVVLVGCNSGNDVPGNHQAPGKNEVAGKEDVAPAPAQQQPAKESPPEPSAEGLVDNYKQAYASGDADAIEQMVYWEGPEDNKEALLNIILSSGSAGDGTITKAELRKPAEDDVKPWATLKAEAILDYTATNKEDSFSKSTSVPIVKVDGEYYFYIAAMPAKEE